MLNTQRISFHSATVFYVKQIKSVKEICDHYLMAYMQTSKEKTVKHYIYSPHIN